jgi:putative (di)nucleoside polyphosphate hydrolase
MPKPHFRAGVITAVRRSDGQLMAFERADLTGEWQLPQGGIETGETAEQAAWRELREETGLGRRDVTLVDQHATWTVYEWPTEMRTSPRLGQVHRWFFFDAVNDSITPQPDGSEFIDWRWMPADELIDRVVEFRKEPYRQVLGRVVDNG